MNNIEEGINVYADLGFKDADEMLVKAQLVVKIAEILRERRWSQQQSAKVLGLTQPKLSKMLRGQFRGISEMKMMDCLIRLGRPVRIVVGPEGQAADERIEVVAARDCRMPRVSTPRPAIRGEGPAAFSAPPPAASRMA